MTRTYRSPAPDPRPLAGLLWFYLLSLAVVGPPLWSDGFTVGSIEFLGVLTVVTVLLLIAGYRHQYLGICHEIRLDDDGGCEFTMRRRTLRLDAADINAVRYSRETDESPESYEIRYDGGKLYVDNTMIDFLDFVQRLSTLNPAVDLVNFPAAAQPALGGVPNVRRNVELGHVLRSALFPAVVVLLLVWLATQTLR